MSFFVVTEGRGPSWDATRPRRDAETRLAEDPWMTMGILRVATIEPWEILLDGCRVTRGQLG